MAAKDLKVDELRRELAKRGLDTAGLKPSLVGRLEAAIRDESDGLKDSKGRERETDGEPSEAPGKRKAIDELRSMTVKKLREEALNIGISAAGTKQELVERLSAADNGNESDSDQVEEENEEENANTSASQKVEDIDELRSMTVKQLREEASNRGISTAGTKQELVERLSAADNENASDDDQGN